MPHRLRAFCVIFLAVGTLLLGLAAFAASRSLRMERTGMTAPGHVIRLERGSRRSAYPVVEFQTRDQERITFRGSVGSSPPAFHVGEAVTVLYDPDDPSHATIQSFGQMWTASLFLGLFGLIFAGIPSGIIFSTLRGRKRAAWLRQYGQRVTTRFDRVELNTKLRVNGVSPYRIVSQGQNPFTAQVQTFHSDNLWTDPTPYIGERSIDVLIDPNNPTRYWLDTGFLPFDVD